jgi:hypothetical protein
MAINSDEEAINEFTSKLEKIPGHISSFCMVAVLAPIVVKKLSGNDQELKYKVKFGIQKMIEAAQELVNEAKESLDEIDKEMKKKDGKK